MSMLWLALLSDAGAFCGFYVAGADQSLYNDATMVVMMRSGTKTVLSMQNSYQGPPEAFAMVVPVPQVLQKENVRTLPREIFAHVDKLSAPRLVEYWESDPCAPPPPPIVMAPTSATALPEGVAQGGGADGVKIEAQFEVGEYDVVILSATDSSGLERWLLREKYNIPQGAEPVLRPYVEAGTKFFVARVIPEKVTFQDGRAVLSPLRVHYDSEQFTLPVRLGLLNSKGEQDLIVHILAPSQRYEVANYQNAFIPTNLRVQDAVRTSFGSFYEAIFKEVSKPGTVVTEYSWDAGSCDPCPEPPLDDREIATLGGDVVGNSSAYGYVLTRLHYRYGKDGLKEDLVFKDAPGVEGGRGTPSADGTFTSHAANPSSMNQFQGRYAILHPWKGEVACKDPRRGNWGGPPAGEGSRETASAPSRLTPGGASAPASSAPVPIVLADVLVDGFGSVTPRPQPAPEPATPPPPGAKTDEEKWCATSPAMGGWLALGAVLMGLARRRREP
jgi:MYXO-CTERM domain-containing protein